MGIVIACICVSFCVCVSVTSLLHDNSSPVQARITKFGADVQNTLIKIHIVLGSDCPWRCAQIWVSL